MYESYIGNPPPLKGGGARKPLRYKGKGAQNQKNLYRKTEKKKKKRCASRKGVRKIFVNPPPCRHMV